MASVFVSLPSHPPASLENQPLTHPARTGQGRTCKAPRNIASIATHPRSRIRQSTIYAHTLWSLLRRISSQKHLCYFFHRNSLPPVTVTILSISLHLCIHRQTQHTIDRYYSSPACIADTLFFDNTHSFVL